MMTKMPENFEENYEDGFKEKFLDVHDYSPRTAPDPRSEVMVECLKEMKAVTERLFAAREELVDLKYRIRDAEAAIQGAINKLEVDGLLNYFKKYKKFFKGNFENQAPK